MPMPSPFPEAPRSVRQSGVEAQVSWLSGHCGTPAFPDESSGADGVQLADYSCGGSSGMGRRPRDQRARDRIPCRFRGGSLGGGEWAVKGSILHLVLSYLFFPKYSVSSLRSMSWMALLSFGEEDKVIRGAA